LHALNPAIEIQQGNEQAFEQIYYEHHYAVLANINRVINNPVVAEDLLQEVFVSLWENRHKLTDANHIAGWLFTASHFKALDYLKKAVKENLLPLTETLNELIPSEETKEQEKEYLQLYELLTEAIGLLSPRKQTVFRLCRLEGKSYKEAAATLNISVESVKDYLKISTGIVRQHVLAKGATISLLSLYILGQLLLPAA
jgi:RNA polymerase sigma-70 factor (ECF subfamily)